MKFLGVLLDDCLTWKKHTELEPISFSIKNTQSMVKKHSYVFHSFFHNVLNVVKTFKIFLLGKQVHFEGVECFFSILIVSFT